MAADDIRPATMRGCRLKLRMWSLIAPGGLLGTKQAVCLYSRRFIQRELILVPRQELRGLMPSESGRGRGCPAISSGHHALPGTAGFAGMAVQPPEASPGPGSYGKTRGLDGRAARRCGRRLLRARRRRCSAGEAPGLMSRSDHAHDADAGQRSVAGALAIRCRHRRCRCGKSFCRAGLFRSSLEHSTRPPATRSYPPERAGHRGCHGDTISPAR